MEDYKLFEHAADHIQSVGWTRGQYQDANDGSTCLVGGIGVARRKLYNTETFGSNTLTNEIAEELDNVLKSNLLYWLFLRGGGAGCKCRDMKYHIQEAVQGWNDIVWRRKKTVIKVLRKAAENSKAKHIENRMLWLEAEVTRLEAEVSHLQSELDKSEKEVSRLRRILGYKQPTQADHDELQSLSDELDQRWAELNSLSI